MPYQPPLPDDWGALRNQGRPDAAASSREPTLADAAKTVAAILAVIVKMSDDVKNAASPLDAQGKLLRMQNSIQKNAARIVPHVRVILGE